MYSCVLETMSRLLDGATYAVARRPDGKPCPILWPDDAAGREALIRAHYAGSRATVTFAAGSRTWRAEVPSLELAAYAPAAEGLTRSIAVDLDGPTHGAGGLADPAHAARVIAERAENAGLAGGLIVAESRSGDGRHVWLVLPGPTELCDAALGLGALVASAFAVATRDAHETGAPHAFATVAGPAAVPGQAGAVELFPPSTQRPTRGWSLRLPFYRGLFVAERLCPFRPGSAGRLMLNSVPAMDPGAWARWVDDARRELTRKRAFKAASVPAVERERAGQGGKPSARTQAFLDGRAEPGSRNAECFAAAANLAGLGWPAGLIRGAILSGAERCGLPRGETEACIASALRSKA